MAKAKTKEWFINKALEIHGDKYNYSKVEYVNSSTKVCILCPEHGEFWQTPSNHLKGKGCKQCAISQIAKSKRLSLTSFVEKSYKVHGGKYNYSKVEYQNNSTKVLIICPIHGEFWQTPAAHIKGQGCPKCGIENNRGMFFGVGVVDDYARKNKELSKCYIAWRQMLSRCYGHESPENKMVCDEWKSLRTFRQWFDKHYIEGWHLDKDIRVKGNKIYSPETCCFVPQEINALFKSNIAFLQGLNIEKCRKKNKYAVYGYCGLSLRRKRIKRVDDLETAIRETLTNKYLHAIEVSEAYYAKGLMPKETLEYITNRSNQEIDNIDNVVRKVTDKFNEIKEARP